MMRLATLLALFWMVIEASFAAGSKLAPYKDRLFTYPPVLEQSKDGSYTAYAYDKQRDIVGRDRLPRRKAKQAYVDERVRWSRRLRRYKSPNGSFKYFSVGKHKGGAQVTVIYVHGKGGNRRQGVNDWTFGGNFNRLQNLMTRNKGLLLSPDFSDFKEAGAADIEALMAEFRRRSPKSAMIIACGSMGGGVCWQLASNPKTAAWMDGMFILGSHWDDSFLKSPAARKGNRSIPILFAHGSKDSAFSAATQRAFFEKLRKQNPAYPARFLMFNSGVHGTPVRMVDWRRELNWMLSTRK